MLELAKRGWPVELLFVGPDGALERWDWPQGITLNVIGENPDDARVQATLSAKLSGFIDWVIIDGYRFRGDKWHTQVNAAGTQLLMLDDIGDQDFSADAVLNQNSDDAQIYTGGGITAQHWLLGPQFALLEPEYVARGRTAAPELRKVLVVFGGADRRQMTPKSVAVLSALQPALELDVVLGPYSNWSDTPPEGPGLRFHRAPAGLAPLLKQADAVVTAAGSTAWQACAANCPAVVVQTVDNQAQSVATLRKSNAALLVDADTLEFGLPRAIETLRSAQERTAFMARAGKLIDGAGSARVIQAMKDIRGRQEKT